MIKFFRKIRQKLLSENKFGKYLLYAIGEIILVVIGILIALQINTDTKQKEDRHFELMMLNNIRNDISEDIGFYEALYNRCKQMEIAANSLLESYGSSNDSLVLRLYPIMTMGISFESRNGAYEALKSTGLDKISNDTIRNNLTTMYDFGLPRLSRWLNDLEVYKEALVQDLEQELFAPEITTDDEGNRIIIQGVKEGDLLKDSRLLNLINIYRYRAQEQMTRLANAMPFLRTALTSLNSELKERYPKGQIKEEELESVGILGTATEGGWETDIDMLDVDQDGIYVIETTLMDGEVKFRANDKWEINWGGIMFPKGQGFRNGINISVKEGRYKISLNIKNGFYQFDKVDK